MSRHIRLISASAGSGKTYSLTETFVQGLDNGVRPEGVVATTFTKKAAQEIGSRFRSRLFELGLPDAAQRVFDGYIGTVNAVCGALLKDYAFEIGQSPTLEVLPDGEDGPIFRVAVAGAVDRRARVIAPLARRLNIENWGGVVKEMVDKARANAIDRKTLLECGSRSWESFRELLPEPMDEAQGAQLDTEIVRELARTIDALPAAGDATAGTRKGRETLLAIQRTLDRETLPDWATWAKLAKVSVTKKSEHEVAALNELAGQMLAHPRFHADIRQFIERLFDCAAESAGYYQQYKTDLGLIDFTDQEALALRMLDDDRVADQLRDRLDMIMVDEFQDTSPIQLALFLKLSGLVDRSVWVGDQKQSIYGFRGSDPALMDAVIDSLGEPETLPNSWRSQPALVDFASEFFAAAFGGFGFPEERVRLTSKVDATNPKHPHLRCWRLQAKNNAEDTACLIGGIRDMLDTPEAHVVLDKTSKTERSLRAGDIAVLCRTNPECERVAACLEEQGIRAAIPRAGLMDRPETVLVMAAYRYLLSPDDTLAVAELARLFDLDDWFSLALRKGMDEVKGLHALFADLDAARPGLASLTPSEVLDLAITLSDAGRIALGWGNPALRQANLDALRGHAMAYEGACKARRCACTPAGLAAYLDLLADEGTDAQAVGCGDDAVQVLTYHKSKGLEWPVVILTGLNAGERGTPFGLSVQAADVPFDLDAPLAGRWLRYWPWPFDADMRMKVDGFSDVVGDSDAAKKALDQERRERLRLLYVGMTRARDHMILAAREVGNRSTTAWLDGYVDGRGEPILSLPEQPGLGNVTVDGKLFPMETLSLAPCGESEGGESGVRYAPVLPAATGGHPPARFVPSGAAMDVAGVALTFFELGPPLREKMTDSRVALGNAVHGFLALAPSGRDDAQLRTRAARIVKEVGLADLSSDMLLEIHHRLHEFIATRIDPSSTGRVLTEWPIHLRRGLQQGHGWIDMLSRLPGGDVIIDHKTSLGDRAALEKKAKGYAGQLAAYAEALKKATGKPVQGTWLHFALAGVMVNVEFPM